MVRFSKKEKFDGLYNDGISIFGKFNRLINSEISKKGNLMDYIMMEFPF